MLIEDQINEVLIAHKSLVYDENLNLFSGEIILPDGDSYEVTIELEQYPRFFPKVYEMGGRIPWKVERHIFPSSGSCCFTTKAKSQILLKTKVNTLKFFIDEIVIPYFQNNSYFEINKKYYTDEYSHNYFGNIEGYMDILKTENILIVARTLIQVIDSEKLKIHQNCYCGSGKRLRKCHNGKHLKNMRYLFLVDKEVLIDDFQQFDKIVNSMIRD